MTNLIVQLVLFGMRIIKVININRNTLDELFSFQES